MAKKNYEMDMCHGPLVGKILLFALPVMLSGVLQLLLTQPILLWWGVLPAVRLWQPWESNGALINLIVNVFIGVSNRNQCTCGPALWGGRVW